MTDAPVIAGEDVDRLRRLFARDNSVLGLTLDDRYQVLRRIGQGGRGDVFMALDQRLHRRVALKVLSALRPRPEWIATFRAEAQILSALEPFGIVPVTDLGILPDGRVYVTMKLVEGRTFDRHADRRTLIRLLADACLAVHRAHEAGVLHRNLKPANLMVDDAGRVLVLDGGIAPSGLSGTAAYMAPEQAWGFARKIDRRADVYGLGAVLYELLTRRPPIEGGTERDRLAAARVSRIAPLRSAGEPIPRNLEAICLKALQPDRRARHATARDLQEDLVRFLEGRPAP